MQIVEIEHDRCCEYEKTDYWLAPDEMTSDQIEAAVGEAKNAYLAAHEKAQSARQIKYPSNNVNEYPDNLTIAEVKQKIAETIALRSEAERLISLEARSFPEHLKKAGIIPIRDYPYKIKTSANWGHNHGSTLNY